MRKMEGEGEKVRTQRDEVTIIVSFCTKRPVFVCPVAVVATAIIAVISVINCAQFLISFKASVSLSILFSFHASSILPLAVSFVIRSLWLLRIARIKTNCVVVVVFVARFVYFILFLRVRYCSFKEQLIFFFIIALSLLQICKCFTAKGISIFYYQPYRMCVRFACYSKYRVLVCFNVIFEILFYFFKRSVLFAVCLCSVVHPFLLLR